MLTKKPITTWLVRSRMKLRSRREVYWLATWARVASVSENIRPATVIMEPAMAASMPRAPAAPAPNSSGCRAVHFAPMDTSSRTSPYAANSAATTIRVGTNQRLESSFSYRAFSLFIYLALLARRPYGCAGNGSGGMVLPASVPVRVAR